MKKMTIRLDDYIYDRVNLIASKNQISANKLISNIVKNNLSKNNDLDYSNELNIKLDNLINDIKVINKRQLDHFNVSMQHFSNHGYLGNRPPKEDKVLQEIFTNKFNK